MYAIRSYYEATDKAGADVTVLVEEAAPLCAFVFKTVADPFVGKMSFIKVISGTIKSGS